MIMTSGHAKSRTAFAALALSGLLAILPAAASAEVQSPAAVQANQPAAAAIARSLAETSQKGLLLALMEKAPKLSDPKVVRIIGDRGPMLYEAVREASLETWNDARPHVEAILTHALAENFSADELAAGSAFLQGPDQGYAFEIYINKTTDEAKRKPLSDRAAAALARLESTDAGRRFVADATAKDGPIVKARLDLIAAIAPGWILRFSDKLDAAEAAHPHPLATDAFAPTAEDQALGVGVVHNFLGAIDPSVLEKAKPLIIAGMEKKMAERPDTKMPRPEWNVFMVDAMIDSLAHDRPAIELAFGRMLARLYSHDDLQALADFANGPGMDFLKRSMAERKPGEAPVEKTPEEKAALAALAKRDLLAKSLAHLGDFASNDPEKKDRMFAMVADVGLTWGPKLMRRFAVEAQALEEQKRAARGW